MKTFLLFLGFWLFIKHCLCDKVLNSESLSNGKRKNGWAGNRNLLLHSGMHGLMTAFCVLFIGVISMNYLITLLAIPIGLLDVVLHSAIDKLKVIIEGHYAIVYKSFGWYCLTLFDQGLHVLSYGLYIYIIYLALL